MQLLIEDADGRIAPPTCWRRCRRGRVNYSDLIKHLAKRLSAVHASTMHLHNMHILLIRHGIAEDRDGWIKAKHSDDERPLSRAGRRKLRRGAKGLANVVPHITVLASSPLVRAVQSAQIIAKEFPKVPILQITHLSPRKPPSGLLNWLQTHPASSTVALVGHEPHLSTFVGWMTTGLQESFITFKKGGACLLQIGNELKPARAKIVWVLKPGQLRKLGR